MFVSVCRLFSWARSQVLGVSNGVIDYTEWKLVTLRTSSLCQAAPGIHNMGTFHEMGWVI